MNYCGPVTAVLYQLQFPAFLSVHTGRYSRPFGDPEKKRQVEKLDWIEKRLMRHLRLVIWFQILSFTKV